MAENYQIENILVAQKNLIISMINDGKISSAYAMLMVVRELWENCDYGYKVKEIDNRIFEASKQLAS